MKKVLVSLLTLALLCALTACGGQAQSGGNDGEASQQPSATPAPDNRRRKHPPVWKFPLRKMKPRPGTASLWPTFPPPAPPAP